MSTHNIWFHAEIRKNLGGYPLLSGTMKYPVVLLFMQISGDDESAVISLTPLQTLARDIRILLQIHGKMSLSLFERLFYDQFGTEIKPALYGFPTTVALLMTIPHVVTIKGKGYRRMVHLSGDLQSKITITSYVASDKGLTT